MAVDVEAALWEAARARAAQHGYGLGQDAEFYLREFVHSGAEAMIEDGVVDEAPQMDEAIVKLEGFVDLMAEEVVLQGYTEFHEPTFFAARERFCKKRPNWWPFCTKQEG